MSSAGVEKRNSAGREIAGVSMCFTLWSADTVISPRANFPLVFLPALSFSRSPTALSRANCGSCPEHQRRVLLRPAGRVLRAFSCICYYYPCNFVYSAARGPKEQLHH